MMTNFHRIALISLVILLSICSAGCMQSAESEEFGRFSGDRAYQDVIHQVALGARHPGTIGHDKILNFMEEELIKAGWEVELHEAEIEGKPVINLIAGRGNHQEYILLGAHYDTRIFADQDPDEELRNQPVPGANDGGSGVAVLLELARTLPEDLPISVRLVFFDSEDNGGIEDWDWIMGSRAYVRDIDPLPLAAVILDMIGDADLEIYYERNSDHLIREQIWNVGIELGYGDFFFKEEKHSMLDDHTPFLQAGIPAVDLIDFDYPYWHTTEDTSDKVSPESLQAIGDTITVWLLGL